MNLALATPPVKALSTGFAKQFVDHVLASNLSPNTARGYRADLHRFIEWLDGSEPTTDEIDILAREWLTYGSQGLSPATIKRRLATLQSYGKWMGFGDAFLEGYKPPRLERIKAHPLPGGMRDVDLLLGVASDENEFTLVFLCSFMGLRVNEAVTVRGSDINQEARSLRVDGKGSKKRELPLTETTWPTVAAAGLRTGFQARPLVPIANATARVRVRQMGARAGLSRAISSHDLRSTFATDMYQRTLDILTVKEWMGHSDIKTTMRYVASDDLETMREAGL